MARQPAQADLAKLFEQDPLLADFARPFPNLLGSRRALGASFQRVAQALSRSKRTASVQFSLRSGKQTQFWTVSLTPKGAEVTSGSVEKPSLDIRTDTESWTEIASGKLSPLEAFGSGRLELLGSIELARLVARSVTTTRRK